MDIAAALTTVSHTISLVRILRDIEKGFDSASVRAQMADLHNSLADVKIALSEAQQTIHAKDIHIKALEEKISNLTSGEACPKCRSGRLSMTASHQHPLFGRFGVQEQIMECEHCDYTENRMYDPRKGRQPG